jgi:predicted metal-dependent phosphoesterase TrpH
MDEENLDHILERDAGLFLGEAYECRRKRDSDGMIDNALRARDIYDYLGYYHRVAEAVEILEGKEAAGRQRVAATLMGA